MVSMAKLEGVSLEAVRQGHSEIKEKAIQQLGLKTDEIVTRELRPEDVGLTTPEFTFNIASGTAWNTMIDAKTIDDNRFVMIYGVRLCESTDSPVSQLKLTRAGQVKRYWQIQGANYNEDAVVYFTDPVIIDQNTSLTLEGYGVTTDTAFKCVLLGEVVEKKGLLIQ